MYARECFKCENETELVRGQVCVHLNNGVTSVKQRSLCVHGSSLGPNPDSGENGKTEKDLYQ